MSLLTVESVTVDFGGLRALDDVTLTAEAGSIVGLIGPNGAGKSTLFNVIAGLERPTRGRVILAGRDISKRSTAARARHGIARTFQQLELFHSLSVYDNVRVACEVKRRGRVVGADEVLSRLGLYEFRDLPANRLSTGTARLLEVARALALDPAVLLLDEPSAGLDDYERERLKCCLTELASEGLAIVLVEHDVSVVAALCSQVTVLEFGKVIAVGTMADLQRNDRVLSAYLGPTGGLISPSAPSNVGDRGGDHP